MRRYMVGRHFLNVETKFFNAGKENFIMRKKYGVKMLVIMLGLLSVLSSGAVVNAKAPPPAASSININVASMDSLMSLPGIGKSKASAIINYRVSKKFANKNELLAVKGIGEKLLARISPYITVTHGVAVQKAGTAGKTAR